MKFSLLTLKSIVTDKRSLAALALCLVLVGGFVYLATRSSSRFESEYAAYAVLAKEQEDAAYLPAAPNNPVREELASDLAQALDQNTSAPARLKFTQDGLDRIKELEAQVDAIGDAGDKANVAIAQMQVDALKDFSSSGVTHEIIELAKQRSAVIEDIRGLSYRADFETSKIFDRIVSDKGELTAAHVADLNDEIPLVEEQFNQRSSLYTELTSLSAEIDQKAAGIGIPAAVAPSVLPQ